MSESIAPAGKEKKGQSANKKLFELATIQEILTQSMSESIAPAGKEKKGQSANKKLFELATASPAKFFVHISPLLLFLTFGYLVSAVIK